MSVVYDAGALIAADRGDPATWHRHEVLLGAGQQPLVTAPVVAQVSRSPRQAMLHRFLRGCEIVPFAPEDAHDVGRLLAGAGSADVVDAHVVAVASRARAEVWTSDPADLRRLADQVTPPVPILLL